VGPMTAGRLTVGRFTADHAIYYRKFIELIIRVVDCTQSEKIGCGIKSNIVKSVVKSNSQIIDANVVVYEFISKLCVLADNRFCYNSHNQER